MHNEWDTTVAIEPESEAKPKLDPDPKSESEPEPEPTADQIDAVYRVPLHPETASPSI